MNWESEDAACWDRYHRQFPEADALEFEHCRERIGSKAVGHLLEMVAAGWTDLVPARVVRYLEKHDVLQDGVQLLIDYRKMMRDAELAETEETLWPRDLLAAHDRIAQFSDRPCKSLVPVGLYQYHLSSTGNWSGQTANCAWCCPGQRRILWPRERLCGTVSGPMEVSIVPEGLSSLSVIDAGRSAAITPCRST